VVALDPRTGEVLAMASRPAPDPRDFAKGIESDKWRQLNESSDAPMLNRAIQAQLAPGSVFKIVMSAAFLDDKSIPQDFSVYCSGAADFYGRPFRCHIWKKGGHGEVHLHKAVVQSCDIFFYNVGKRLGIERIAQYAKAFGLGRRTGIDLPGEEAGLVPSEEWKRRAFKQKWYAGETISVAIGQGALMSTPLQLARTVGGVALGGVFKQPHLLKDMKDVAEERFPMAEEHTERITQAMFGVVNEGGGTAGASRLQGIEFCGKTGTAQLISTEGLARIKGSTRHLVDNAWFVGYAPRRNPEIVVAVLVEQGAHGSSAAAPIARDIVKRYYEKKSQREKQQLTAGAVTPAGPAESALPAATVRRSPKVVARREDQPAGGAQPR
jgi:penicillin-binding protein 2